jgi:nitrogen-specific signal transduction histidine kinase/ActR/RegA family two-component response regulator
MKDITRQIENERKLNKIKQYENIGLLAGGIAHDFNNILSSFYNYLEILKLKCSDEEICQMIDKIFINLNRGKALAAQLLTFAKGGKPSTKPFDTVKCVKSVAEFVLSGTDIVLDFVSKGEIKSCLGDEDQIGQAIENIVINARQAISKDGKIDVTISNMTNNEAKAYFKNENLKHENYILITVTDNGKGMDEETAKNVFDPFFTTREDGYGLGLTTAHNIIKKHEGDISLESKIGEGTKVSIILPATEQKCENYIQEEKRDVINDKLNILIMDDEEDILYSLSELLKILGYNPLMAKNGEEAIKIYKDFLLKGEKIDLCILDITIRGGMGGKETVKRLIEIDENVKAVVSSGYSEDPIISMPQEYGFVASLQKPFKIDELVKLLREIL